MRHWERAITPEQREAIRSDVRHEWRMVQQLNQVLIDDFWGDFRAEWCVRTALLDSFLMHARNLHDFFLQAPRRKGDVAARHLLPPEHADWHPTGLDSLSASIDLINKRFSHITYGRTDGDVSWYANGLREEIDSAFAQFIELLPESSREFWQA